MNRTFTNRLLHETNELTVMAREKRKGFIFPVEIVIFIALFFVIDILISAPFFLIALFTSGETVNALVSGPYGGVITIARFMVVIGLYMLYCRVLEKRSLRSMGFQPDGILPSYLQGMAAGFLMFSVVVMVGVLLGGFRFDGLQSMTVSAGILYYLLLFLVQGMEEEVICRGYFMISLSRRSPMWLSVPLNALVFAALHLLNPGVGILPIVNLMLFGVFASLYMLRTGNIWGIGAFHSIWNFAQGNFYGLQVSGLPELPSLFRFSSTGSALINGGDFGPEGGLPVTIVYLVGIALVLLWPERKKKAEHSYVIAE